MRDITLKATDSIADDARYCHYNLHSTAERKSTYLKANCKMPTNPQVFDFLYYVKNEN